MRPSALLSILPLVAAAGCAAPGPYPSLAPREAERLYASGDPVRVAPDAPDRAGLASRIAALLAEGRSGNARFEEALGSARSLASRAGSPGSESWIAAQQALSRAEAARAATVGALADLDALAVEEARKAPLSPGDYRRLVEGTAALQAIADRQHDQLARLQGALSR